MKKNSHLIWSHGLIALAGLAIAFGLRRGPLQNTDQAGAGQSQGTTISIRTSQSRGPQSVREFKRAWQSLPDLKLSTKDRIKAQRKLLADWAELDLRGAMQAVVDSDWGEPGGMSSGTFDFKGPLASALEKAMADKPGESWDLITSDEFGLGRSMLRNAWFDGVGKDNPVELANVYHEISWRDQGRVLKILKNNVAADKKKRAGVLAALLEVPDHQLSASQILPFMPEQSAEEIARDFANLTDFEDRNSKVTTLRYGMVAYDGFMKGSVNDETLAQLRNDVERLPGEMAGELLVGILTRQGQSTYGAKVEQTTELIGLLIEKEQWKAVSQKKVWETWKHARGMTPKERATWAVNLPERPETTELFHRGVDKYIAENQAEAWDWIQEFPEGLWRDRAFSEYSQQALQTHKNYEESRRALDQISDPGFKKTAESWRPGWAKEMDQ